MYLFYHPVTDRPSPPRLAPSALPPPLPPEPTVSLATPHIEVPLSGSLPYPKLGPGPVGW